jgi:MBG domain (YGX type)/Calcineurin-like phosphoesterase/Bacterial Ig-like domain (group 3)/Purple acid Phosphatase, N-terminal domain
MFRRLLFLLGFWLPVTIGFAADEISLVRVGEVWSYRIGTNAPSTPITSWRNPGFDDSAWSQGLSGFTTLFTADNREATFWQGAENYHSVFLRKRFNVADTSAIKWLILRLNYDDGFVAYLNGHEIARRGLTNDPVAFDDFADVHPLIYQGGAAEEFDISPSAGSLTVGENLLALEVHTAITNESGNTNGMRLVPELLANFQRGPFIQNATTNSMQVIWRTPVPADSVVDFGTDQNLGSEISDSTLTTNHVLTVTNLLPGSQYFYSVRSTTGGVSAVSTTNSFHTLKMSGDVSFLVLGDTGTGLPEQYAVANAMLQTEADLVMQTGDVIDIPYFTFGLEDARVLSVFRRQMRSVPFFFTLGNHEVDNGVLGTAYLATFHLPTNSVTGTSHYYSFDHGDAHFAVLYMPFYIEIPALDAYRLYEGSDQYNWLTNDLASSTKPWKFLFVHHPLASSGSHRNDHYGGSLLTDAQVLQDLLLPVATRYGVEMIFNGHDHDYERFNPIQGVQLIANGAGGSQINGIHDERDGASSQFYGIPEFLKVTIQGDSLFLQAINTNGNVFDYMSLRRTPPPAQLYESSWHTPVVETAPADDGHGNINGQTFDFVGTPIPTMAGKFSNLGRVYVNNDLTNLFIGFDQAMFYSNNNVFLFIETPGKTGVTNLIGMGNGIADNSEGVDGLDILENLSFTNFAPSVGCLLGDEFADGQFRNFTRPGMELNMGQGVFGLDPGFTNVPGIRLQQFNRSPQVLGPLEASFPERNANFIEVAIPYDQLGNLQPGDTIKIGAVVGLAGYDTNAQTREIDTSFLGTSMTGSGQSNVVLEAVSVHLSLPVLTVKADDKIRAYGATNPPLTTSYSGFANGDDPSVLSGSPVLSTVADTNSPVGTYPIIVSQGTLSNAHYNFSFTNGTLTVTQAVLNIFADSQTRYYGTTNSQLTGSILGVQNGDQVFVNYSTVADTNSPIGSYAILASALGDLLTNYLVIVSNGTVVVSPAPLSVAADNKSRAYATTNPPFTGTIVGVQNNDSISASYSTPAVVASPVGTYPIQPVPSGSGLGNYVVSTNNGTLTVTSAPLIVKADDRIRTYGQTNDLTFSLIGLGEGQATNTISGIPSLTTSAETNSPIGQYEISVSAGTLTLLDSNYDLSFSNGTLTVTQTVLTVEADDQTRIYGATNPPLTFSFDGFVNGDGTNIVNGEPALSTDADTNSSVGTYAITVGQGTLGLTDTNYGLAFVNGTLTVTPASSSNSVVSSLNPSITGDNVTFMAMVSPIPPANTFPTGNVTFLTNDAVLAIAPLSNGMAGVSTKFLPPGTNGVVAAYTGDGNYFGSTNGLQQSVTAVCSDTNYILSVVIDPTNTFTFTFVGSTNSQYRVLQTADPTLPITNWTVVSGSTNVAFDGTWQYTVTNDSDAAFFRVEALAPCP